MPTTPANEPRALSAVLAQPAAMHFGTRGGTGALHAAERHVERWAPEAGASRVRPLRSLGFVDRLIAPWIETAQRSASLRLFSQYASVGAGERAPSAVSWVFPRPWYQDELDWMTAARQLPQAASVAPAAMPTAFTTRGTYVPQRPAMPSALYEYVAPSLSVASPAGIVPASVASGSDAYSPLIPLAAVQAAQVMQRTLQRLPGGAAGGATAIDRNPALRDVLSAMLARSATTPSPVLGVAMQAPELVTPPAPRADDARPDAAVEAPRPEYAQAFAVAEQLAAQRAQIADVQRVARHSAERELAARVAAAPNVQDTVARAEAELRQRLVAARPGGEATTAAQRAEQARSESQQAAQQAQAIEERVARRIAERTAGQRLHEQARGEAAVHARAAAQTELAAQASATRETPATEPGERRAPAEVVAAIAALPPELASFLARHPAMTAGAAAPATVLGVIEQVVEAYRTVELIARTAATGGAMQSVRGPRLTMPAGMGGLVAAVDHAHAIAEPARRTGAFAATPGDRGAASPSTLAMPPVLAADASMRAAARVPTLPWLASPDSAARRGAGPSTAIGATEHARPAALGHVAWADRWLARFAGASPQSLATLQAGIASPRALELLAAAAPGAVFVSPERFDAQRDGEAVRFDATGRTIVTPAGMAAPMTVAPPQASAGAPATAEVVRIADDAETPDDLFAAISEAASRKRASTTPAAAAATPAATARAATSAPERATFADHVAHAAPAAPGAGFAAQLASSPFAPALRHVLALPAAAAFDVRSLFGGALSSTYLAGLLAPASRELDIAAASPAWASPARIEGLAEREVPSWDAAYVAPEDLATGDRTDASEAARFETPASAALPAAATMAPLTTLRSALLAWDVADPAPAPGVHARMPVSSTSPAHAMIEAMSLPMLGDLARGDASGESAWSAPGMVAERARSWAVAQERSSADLAFDFVTPELVLAARVYGLGPIEAAQAARLAIAGPGQLTAMAGTVDRTFLQAMAPVGERLETERRTARGEARVTTAFPLSSGDLATYVAPQSRDAPGRPEASTGTASTASASTASTASASTASIDPRGSSSGSTFGVERRMPRGAFLWPAGTVAALHLNAAAPDGEQSMSVAALELIAAQAVAELGSYALLPEVATADEAVAVAGAARAAGMPMTSAGAPDARGSTAAIAGPGSRSIASGSATAEPGESDVLATATALVPMVRRARFEALYLALGSSPAGRTWSPAARAARALALTGRGEDVPVSAHERAMTAWDVLPVVYAMGDAPIADADAVSTAPSSAGRSRAARRAPGTSDFAAADTGFTPVVDSRPGLGALSARAGEALGSYVTPTAQVSTPAPAREREVGAVLRAPTAAQEMVQTGRPAGRFGGGEAEIPAWFEAAARKMFDNQHASTMGDGISMAELTLIAAAPSHQIAASTRAPASAAASVAPASASGDAKGGQKIDIEKTANEIYRQILAMMDAARARNGEPYL